MNEFKYSVRSQGTWALIPLSGKLTKENCDQELEKLRLDVGNLPQRYLIFDFSDIETCSLEASLELKKIIDFLKGQTIQFAIACVAEDIKFMLVRLGAVSIKEMFTSVPDAWFSMSPKLLTAAPTRLPLKQAA